MSIRKTAQGRWRATLKNGRDYITSRTFDRKTDAAAWLDRERRLLRIGDVVDPKDGREKVRDLTKRWLDLRKGSVAEKTLKTDTSLLIQHLPPKLGNMPVSSVLPLHIEEALAELARTMKMSTVKRFRGTVSSMFGWAVGQKIIRTNPVAGARMPRVGASPSREVEPFTLVELEEVYSEQRQINPQLAECVLVLGLTGIRWGELRGLRVKDYQRVPYPALVIRRSAPDGVTERETTKSGKTRRVPVPNRVVPLIETRLAGRKPSDLLFTGPNGGRLHGSNFRRDLQWAATSRGRRIHDLRHTAAVIWLSCLVPPRTVQEWLGHSSMRVTEIYSHYLGQAAEVDAIAKINLATGSAGGASCITDSDVERMEAH